METDTHRLSDCIPLAVHLVYTKAGPVLSQRPSPAPSSPPHHPGGTSRPGDSHLRNPNFTQELLVWADSVLPAVWAGDTKGKSTLVFCPRGDNTPVGEWACRERWGPPQKTGIWWPLPEAAFMRTPGSLPGSDNGADSDAEAGVGGHRQGNIRDRAGGRHTGWTF